jgi:hypothetical protein
MKELDDGQEILNGPTFCFIPASRMDDGEPYLPGRRLGLPGKALIPGFRF